MRTHKAIIIGGSLGGLFAAHMLRLAGLDVEIFERSGDDLASRGAGIGTHDEMLRVLQRIGIPVDGSIGVEVRDRIVLDAGGRVTHALGLTRIMSAWAHIYTPLRDLLPRGSYRFEKNLEHVEQDDEGVTAIFADGTRVRGDLLIGADGIRSTVRAAVMPQVEPVYAGYVAWRGVVQESAFSSALHDAIFERHLYCLPRGEMVLGYMVPGRGNDVRPGRRAYNWVWYRPAHPEALHRLCTDDTGRCHGTAIAPPLIRADCISGMRAAAHALLALQMKEVVRLTDQPFFQAIFDLESPRMVHGRVALLGDAAFVARPHVGMGVTKAALDAQCLADAIVAEATIGGDLALALRRYDEARRSFGARVVARARRLGAHLEARHGESCGAEDPYERPEVVLRECGANLADIPELAQLG